MNQTKPAFLLGPIRREIGLLIAVLLFLGSQLLTTFTSAQTVVFEEGFESDAASWNPFGSPVTRVVSGTDGVSSSEGGFHARLSGGDGKGAFTRFGGYRTVFPTGGYTTSLDVYLDVAGGFADDSRLDYSSAVSKPDGTHLRDFVFNIGFYSDTAARGFGSGAGFIFSTSTGSGQPPYHVPNDPIAVNASGWYTLEHEFSNAGGFLQVTFRLKQGASLVKTWVRATTDAIPSQVGGNRYGWLINGTSLGSPDFPEFPHVLVDRVIVSSPAPASLPVFNVTKNTFYSTIQGAINLAATGDIIQVAAGSFTEAVNLNKAVTLRGAKHGVAAGASPGDRGTGETILDGGIFASAAGAVIDGFTIENGRLSGSVKVGVAVSASNVTVTNTIIEDVLSPAQSDGLSTQTGNNNLTLTNSTIRNNWRGIYLNPGSGHFLSGNLIQGNSGSGVGIGSDGQSLLTLTGNRIEDQAEGWGASAVGAGVVASGNTFVNNTVSVAHYGGSVIEANENYWGSATGPGSTVTGGVNAIAYYTDPGLSSLYAPVTNTNSTSFYASIQAAIDAAGAGDVLAVGAGTFNESVTINKTLTLSGAGPGLTTLVGPAGDGKTATVQIAASNVVVSGFTITRTGNNPTDWNSSGLKSAGFALQGITITGAVIRDNLITGMRTAIDINNSGGHVVRNNVISNNHTGLILRNQTDNLVVEENDITSNRTVGVLFLDASGGSNSPLQQAVGSVFSNNRIAGNWYGQVVDRQTGGSLPAPGANPKTFTYNWFGSLAPLVSTANSAEPGYASLIPVVFGGTAEAPAAGSQPDIAGIASANVDFAPLLAEGTDTDVETVPGRGTYGFQGVTGLDAPAKIITDAQNPVLFQSFAEAFAAAVPGDIIELSPGTHSGAELNLNKAVTIVGANAGTAGDDPGRLPESRILNMKLTVTVPGVVIDGVEIYQTNNTPDAVLVQTAATVKNSVFRRFGVSTGTIARALTTAVGTTGVVVEDNFFTGDASGGLFGGHKTWNSALWLNGGSSMVSGNTFELVRTAINADDLNAGMMITGNAFRFCGTYLAVGGTTPVAGSFTVSGNDFDFDFSLLPSANPTLFNLSNVAAGFRLNVTGNTFDGVATAALVDAQKLALEARNFHRGRSGRNGVVDFVAGEQIVVPGTTIQSAVLAASAGDRVLVGPGTFPENVTVNVSLLIEGSGATTILAPTTGIGVSIAAGLGEAARSGLKNLRIQGNGSSTGLVAGSHTTIEGVTSTGHTNYGISLSAGTDLIITGCHFDGNGSGLKLASTASFTGISVTNSSFDGNVQHGWYDDANKDVKPLLDDVSFTNTSFSGNGLKGLYTERLSNATFDGVTVSGNANSSGYNFGAGIDVNLKWRAFSGITIRNSSFINNGNGSLNGAGLTVKARDDAPSYSSPAASFSGLLVEDCVFSNNERHYVNGEPGKSNAGPSMVTLQRNKFGSMTSGAVVNHSLAQVSASHNYWGAPNPSFAAVVSGDVAYSPWYADEALNYLVTVTNFQPLTIPAGTTQSHEDLYIGEGVTWTVRGTLELSGSFELAPGATLEVIDGDVVFADGSVMSGTFTFFNSFGSIHFNDDVTISGSAEGLILVSDVHVADGATITVEGGGSFTIDGCTVDSDGTFDLIVEAGAEFTMARTVFSDGTITIASGGASLYDNRFDETNIDVVAPSNGARIFHNIFSATTDLDDAGVGTVTTVDAWGNVTSENLTENNLPLGLDISMLPSTRTLADGNAYIQPGDEIGATISVSELQAKISGAEVLLGYNTDYLATEDLGLGANWDSGAIFTEEDDMNVIGRFNAALALDFDFPDPEGTNTDQAVADLGLMAKVAAEGTTQVFHRVKVPSDTIEASRLTKGGASPGYLTPFTSNTGSIVVDGTAPLTTTLLSGASIEQAGEDMTQFITVQGLLEINASAFDALAGIDTNDLADTVVTLVGPATYTASRVSVSAGPNIGGDDYTSFGFEYEVTSMTLNGDYDVVFTVTDRSGNVTATTLGEITINKNELTATVELEGLVAGNVTRQVDFVFTQINNSVIETRSRTVVFTNGVGIVNFTDVDGSTAFLSAKTSTHLRERTGVAFDGDGQASVAYTGAGELQGGDFNGDNIVNLLDYSILRFYWLKQVSLEPLAASAEVTGDGSVNLTDYQILQSNFYQQGDPQ